MDLKLNENVNTSSNGLKAYETPRLESFGDAAEIAKTLDVNKVDQIDIAGNGSGGPPP